MIFYFLCLIFLAAKLRSSMMLQILHSNTGDFVYLHQWQRFPCLDQSKLSKSPAPVSDFRILVYCTSVQLSLAFVIDICADNFFYASILDYLIASDSVLNNH